jgi:uncharacterized protein
MAIDLDLIYRDYYVEELYMTADVETGILYNRAGRRMLALTDDFLIGLHQALENKCGDQAGRVLHRCGIRWGTTFGVGIAKEWADFYEQPFRDFPLAFFQSLLIQEFAHNGWGILDLNYQHYPQGVIWLALEGAVMSELRPTDGKVMPDVLTAGILAGMYSVFLGREVDCVQSQCPGQGFSHSRFLISSPERIASLRGFHNPMAGHDALLERLLEIQN